MNQDAVEKGNRARQETGGHAPDDSTSDRHTVTVEFLGLALQRAGCQKTILPATKLGDIFEWLRAKHPQFLVCHDSSDELQLSAHWLICVNEGQFTRDASTPLADGDTVLILSADVGG